MKIVLFALNSSFVHTNLAIRCLKDYIDKNSLKKHDVLLVEKNHKDKFDEILHSLHECNADLYGFSCYIFNIDEIIQIAKSLKKLLPNSKIVFGGPEVSYDADELMKINPFIDNVICNEAEQSFLDFVNNDDNKKIIVSQPFSKFENQDFLYDDEFKISGNIAYYESCRGCPYNCSYCLSSTTKGIRSKTSQKTLDDLYEFEKFGSKIKIIKFVDRTFNFDIERAKIILNGLTDIKYSKIYHMEMRPELFDDEMFEILARFPKDKLQLEIGIQSTNKKTLEAIDRPSDINKAISNMKRIRISNNIKIHCDLIAGLPFDNINTIRQSYNDVFFACDELQLGFLKMLKGSKIRKQADKFNYIYNDKAPYEVLSNDCISYEMMFKLKRIAALTQRFKNSMHFKKSCEYIVSFNISPFDYFYGFNEYIGEHISHLSQHEAFRKFFEYSSFNIKNSISVDEWDKFIKILCEEYKQCLNKNAPEYFC